MRNNGYLSLIILTTVLYRSAPAQSNLPTGAVVQTQIEAQSRMGKDRTAEDRKKTDVNLHKPARKAVKTNSEMKGTGSHQDKVNAPATRSEQGPR